MKIAESGNVLCNELALLSDPQSVLLLLRHCHVTRQNYLARSVSPVLLKSAADCHDTMSKVICEN